MFKPKRPDEDGFYNFNDGDVLVFDGDQYDLKRSDGETYIGAIANTDGDGVWFTNDDGDDIPGFECGDVDFIRPHADSDWISQTVTYPKYRTVEALDFLEGKSDDQNPMEI